MDNARCDKNQAELTHLNNIKGSFKKSLTVTKGTKFKTLK